MEEEKEQTENLDVQALELELAELKKEIAENQKIEDEKQSKDYEEYQKNNEDIQKTIKTNNEQIKTLSGDIEDLKVLIANENELQVSPEALTYTVQLSQEQIDKMKNKEDKYLELGSLYVSIFIGILLTYVGIKGMFGKWMK